MIELIGWIGSFLLAFCGTPQAYKSYKDGHSNGISWGFIGMWFTGEVFVLLYVMMTTMDIILIFNYLINLIIGYTIIHYKLKPRVFIYENVSGT